MACPAIVWVCSSVDSISYKCHQLLVKGKGIADVVGDLKSGYLIRYFLEKASDPPCAAEVKAAILRIKGPRHDTS